jgi:hypothetical protein
MSYETSPACQMLATHCAVCARPLVDAKSVELGIGPDCRRKYGFDIPCSEESRVAANKLVYTIAAQQDGEGVYAAILDLRALGFERLAWRIAERVVPVQIFVEGESIFVRGPYSAEAVMIMRGVPGRRWVKDRKMNSFPANQRPALFAALCRAYPGATAIGPKGIFKLDKAP